MNKQDKIYVAGHRGLVGSALVRRLQGLGYENLLLRTHAELELTDAAATRAFFEVERPAHVFLAAARVGGIWANNTYPADFLRENLQIQHSVIHAAWMTGVQRLLFLGSSCIYPALAPQPLKEEYLLTGPLEPTNRAYALAKIAGIEMCWSYNRQHGTRYLAAMPTNLYGPGDNYHPDNSHVIPALIRKFHEAKVAGAKVTVIWGTGTPRREFMYSDDMADACIHLMNLDEARYIDLLGDNSTGSTRFEPPLINIGVGHDLTIRELAEAVRDVVGYAGGIAYDASKPDGTPRKLLNVERLGRLGWKPQTPLGAGLTRAYHDFLDSERASRPSGNVRPVVPPLVSTSQRP